mmetsp:Transcript_4394/g.6671  ORF Transcript_4394/g.6671 Transcript_4394/m.6671 type:complete len:148 (-) Transcript_4394:50-493(-)
MKPETDIAYANCINCKELLKIPVSFRCITCPSCEAAMNISVDTASGNKPVKRKRDPGAPRQASNAYMIFCKEQRSRVKKQRPDLAFGKIGAQLGLMWRSMSPEEREPYETKASKDRERFRRESDEYYRKSMAKVVRGKHLRASISSS